MKNIFIVFLLLASQFAFSQVINDVQRIDSIIKQEQIFRVDYSRGNICGMTAYGGVRTCVNSTEGYISYISYSYSQPKVEINFYFNVCGLIKIEVSKKENEFGKPEVYYFDQGKLVFANLEINEKQLEEYLSIANTYYKKVFD